MTTRYSAVLQSLIMILIGGTLFFSIAYFGAVTFEGVYFVECACVLIFLLLLMRQARQKDGHLLLSWGGIILFVFTLCAHASSLYSLYYYRTLSLSMRFFAYVFLYVTIVTCVDVGERRRLLRGLVLFSCGVALFGLVTLFMGESFMFGYHKTMYMHRLTATFVNPNHCACFINLVLPFAFFVALSTEERNRRIVYIIVSVILMSALFLTFSLGGILAWFLSGIGILIITSHKKIIAARTVIFLAVCVGVLATAIVIFIFMMTQYIPYDLHNKVHSLVMRAQVIKGIGAYVLSAFKTNPGVLLWGNGLGTFVYAYNMFQPLLAMQFFEHAHNDYLEVFMDLGIGGLCLIMMWYGICIYNAFMVMNRGITKKSKWLAVASLWSVSAFVIHSLFDFNFYINGNMLLVITLMALVSIEDSIPKQKIQVNAFYQVLFFVILALYVVGVSKLYFSEYFLEKGIRDTQKQSFYTSEQYFARAQSFFPKNAAVVRDHADALYYYAKHEDDVHKKVQLLSRAQMLYVDAIRLNLHDGYQYVRFADLMAYTHHYEEAVRLFDRALAEMPMNIALRLYKIERTSTDQKVDWNIVVSDIGYIIDNVNNFSFPTQSLRTEVFHLLRTFLDRAPPSDEKEALKTRLSLMS